ncbi:hypothetical protein RirG_016970 [Rhizophagus irregularis DAOM 197198w]|nr:hypothetical protein RirG_016970 [Rhizophagus irregularis DAOM 197198w]
MDYKGFSSSSTSFNGFGNRTQANFNLAGPSGSTGLNRPVQNNIANGVNSGGYPPTTSQNTNMRMGKCTCCDSTLRFPITVSCFRCTVCQTINDLKPSIQRSEPITPLTLDRIRSMIDTCIVHSNGKGTPNYELLEQAIQKAFSNWYILNESFSNGRPVALDDCGVALDDVREAYRIICDLPESVIRSMMKSTENILKRPGR